MKKSIFPQNDGGTRCLRRFVTKTNDFWKTQKKLVGVNVLSLLTPFHLSGSTEKRAKSFFNVGLCARKILKFQKTSGAIRFCVRLTGIIAFPLNTTAFNVSGDVFVYLLHLFIITRQPGILGDPNILLCWSVPIILSVFGRIHVESDWLGQWPAGYRVFFGDLGFVTDATTAVRYLFPLIPRNYDNKFYFKAYEFV